MYQSEQLQNACPHLPHTDWLPSSRRMLYIEMISNGSKGIEMQKGCTVKVMSQPKRRNCFHMLSWPQCIPIPLLLQEAVHYLWAEVLLHHVLHAAGQKESQKLPIKWIYQKEHLQNASAHLPHTDWLPSSRRMLYIKLLSNRSKGIELQKRIKKDAQ